MGGEVGARYVPGAAVEDEAGLGYGGVGGGHAGGCGAGMEGEWKGVWMEIWGGIGGC